DQRKLFAIGNRVMPRVGAWISTDDADFLEAEYTLVGIDGLPVTHRRSFYFEKNHEFWIISDAVSGSGSHQVETLFHYDEGIDLFGGPGDCLTASSAEGSEVVLTPLTGIRGRAEVL